MVFPDPSMPSTTNSCPGYWCGASACSASRLGPSLRVGVACPGPLSNGRRWRAAAQQLQLRVGARLDAERPLVARASSSATPWITLRVAPVQALSQAQDRGAAPAPPGAPGSASAAKPRVRLAGLRPPVVAGHQRDDLDLVGLEAPQPAVLDQVVRVPVMPIEADVVSRRRAAGPRTRATPARARAARAPSATGRRATARAAPPAPTCSTRYRHRSASSMTLRRRMSGYRSACAMRCGAVRR